MRRRKFLGVAIVSAIAAQNISCGTLLYPERRGQPAGPLDPKVVILDAIGVLFFFVPGIVAFAVDFATGAIYLPPEEYVPVFGQAHPPPESPQWSDVRDWRSIQVPPEELSNERIEHVVARETGQQVRLNENQVRAYRLNGAASTQLAPVR